MPQHLPLWRNRWEHLPICPALVEQPRRAHAGPLKQPLPAASIGRYRRAKVASGDLPELLRAFVEQLLDKLASVPSSSSTPVEALRIRPNLPIPFIHNSPYWHVQVHVMEGGNSHKPFPTHFKEATSLPEALKWRAASDR